MKSGFAPNFRESIYLLRVSQRVKVKLAKISENWRKADAKRFLYPGKAQVYSLGIYACKKTGLAKGVSKE